METPAQRVARLLTALEDLTRQEANQLRSEDYSGVRETQRRVAPLVENLVVLRDAAGTESRARVAAILEQRRTSEELLAAALGRTREGLRQTHSNQRRLAQFRPAYAGAAGGGQQLSAVG